MTTPGVLQCNQAKENKLCDESARQPLMWVVVSYPRVLDERMDGRFGRPQSAVPVLELDGEKTQERERARQTARAQHRLERLEGRRACSDGPLPRDRNRIGSSASAAELVEL
jgi:hypothetical protein